MRVKTQETQAVFTSSLCQRLAPFVVLVAIALLATKGANAAAITGDAAWSVETRQPQMEFPALTPSTTARVVPAPLEIALQRGQWSRACALAAQALAQSEQDVPALGTFAICAAITNHGTETAAAVRRLHQVEGGDGYYTSLLEGITPLRAGSAAKAAAVLQAVLAQHPDDPLVMYFLGCALRDSGQNDAAAEAFRQSLKYWPDNATALAALANLTAGPGASPADLPAAIRLTRHAAQSEPMNLAYWDQLARLYDRAEQPDQAAAIRLQWLGRPLSPRAAR